METMPSSMDTAAVANEEKFLQSLSPHSSLAEIISEDIAYRMSRAVCLY